MEQKEKELDRNHLKEVLFALLRRGLQQEPSNDAALSQAQFDAVLKLSKRHEVQSLAAYGLLLSGGLTGDQEARCRNSLYRTAAYQERMEREFVRTCNLLEAAGLSYMPLKGSVIRSLYPEPWLRTSGDIDILVKDADRAAAVLTENGYTNQQVGSYHVSLTSPGGIAVEIHFRLMKADSRLQNLLDRVWEYASHREGSCRYHMDPEMFYCYHVAHMAKHMLAGGCGIRYFADLWLLTEKLRMEEEKKNDLLRESGLVVFAEQAERLSRVWFSDGQRDSLLSDLEDFVLCGGVFGSKSNEVRLLRTESDTAAGFFLLRIFKPYRRMAIQYPVLKKCPVLLPVFWIWRWATLLLNRRKIRHAVRELALNKKLDGEAVSAAKRLFLDLELNWKRI